MQASCLLTRSGGQGNHADLSKPSSVHGTVHPSRALLLAVVTWVSERFTLLHSSCRHGLAVSQKADRTVLLGLLSSLHRRNSLFQLACFPVTFINIRYSLHLSLDLKTMTSNQFTDDQSSKQ